MRRRTLALGMAALALLAAGGNKTRAKFKDPGLETAVRMATGKAKGDIHLADLAKVTDLITNAQKIRTLAGIEQMPELTYLHIGFNEVTDLSPVAALTKLDELAASNNKIADLAPIKNMKSLTRLDVSANRITDLTPLSAMTQLVSLKFDDNMVSDLTPLAGLTALHRLSFDNNKVSDLAPLLELCDAGGLGQDAIVSAKGNPLSEVALEKQVPALEARGVKVKK